MEQVECRVEQPRGEGGEGKSKAWKEKQGGEDHGGDGV